MTFAFSIIVSVAVLYLPARQATDSCAAMIPGSLRAAIARAYPGSRLVRELDYDADTIASELEYRDGNRCLGVAAAEVNGDGKKDFIFLIASSTGDALVVAALSTAGTSWTLSTLETFSEDSIPRAYFVNTLKSGSYTDMYALDDAPDEWRPEPGRVRRFTSRRPGFVAGKLEASEVAYFYTGTRWVHLWLSD